MKSELVYTPGSKWFKVTGPYAPPRNRQCFFLHPELFKSFRHNDVDAICKDLIELGLYQLPYPVVDVKFRVNDFLSVRGKRDAFRDTEIGLIAGLGGPNPRFYILDPIGRTYIDVSATLENAVISPEETKELLRVNTVVEGTLIAILATKNTIKQLTVNKLAKLGIGKAEHVYTTTLRLPREFQDTEKATTEGRAVRPHLRRGHIRRQHYGPKNLAIKKVWIEPCFVNVDEDFLSKREAYNVSVTQDEPR